MQNVTFTALEAPQAALQNDDGVVAFQEMEYSFLFFGNVVTGSFDTKIMADGSQSVVNGNGFFDSGHRIN